MFALKSIGEVLSQTTKQTSTSSKRSKRSHDGTRSARSKRLDRELEKEYGPSRKSHRSSIVSDKIQNASRIPHRKNEEIIPRWTEGTAVYVPYDDDWKKDGRNLVLYICLQKIENGRVVYLLKDKPCNHPEAKTVCNSMPENELERVPKNAQVGPDGTAALEE